ncbi:hypothetical protein C3V43_01945 [Bacteroides heparinolyticus]|nr:hypothetical protein [Bacteroides heparinolyticus]AVM56671.1 hypothetical protein C3V43_01945 [Bacteroides heparinolyticus]
MKNVDTPFAVSTVNLKKSRSLMADNYLEKQMEQYQARKSAWEKERKYGKKKARILSALKPRQQEISSTKKKQE